MATSLPFQTRVSLQASYSSEGRHRTIEFGDGYIQRNKRGINYQRRTLNVIHEHLDAVDADYLVTFYEARLIDQDYINVASSALLRTPGNFYVESFDVQMSNDSKRTVSASLIEVFDL